MDFHAILYATIFFSLTSNTIIFFIPVAIYHDKEVVLSRYGTEESEVSTGALNTKEPCFYSSFCSTHQQSNNDNTLTIAFNEPYDDRSLEVFLPPPK